MINWYPGHMTKAMRMMEENLRLVDIVIYVLDARAPLSCINPNFESFIEKLPVIYAVNKAELGDKTRVSECIEYLSAPNRAAFTISATTSKSTAPILSAIKKLCGEKLEKYRKKGVRASIKCMVIGVPNTGKSTIINNLCGSAKTVTGNKAGVTRGKQWVRVNEWLEVLDTPGTLYPKLANQNIAARLAYLGSIKDEIPDTFELACSLTKELNAINPAIICERYKISECEGEECVAAIARARGFMLKGGGVDAERGAAALIDDLRRGRLGTITFDTVAEYK